MRLTVCDRSYFASAGAAVQINISAPTLPATLTVKVALAIMHNPKVLRCGQASLASPSRAAPLPRIQPLFFET